MVCKDTSIQPRGAFRSNQSATLRLRGNERGMALVIALVMLILLSILGTWALDTSSTDLRIAGNYKNNEIAFYAAEAGLGYATNPQILNTCIPANPEALPVPGSTPIPVLNVPPGAAPSFTGTIQYVGCGPVPGSINSADSDPNAVCGSKTYGLYYAVNSRGSSMNNNFTVNVESYAALVRSN